MTAADLLGGFRGRGRVGTLSLSSRRLSRRRRILAVVAVVVSGLLSGGWLWVRDSSLVAVEHVTITGQSGSDATQIRAALRSAARNMTTLDVRTDELRTAVSSFPVVRDVKASTRFPHGMVIRVIEQVPVGVALVEGRRIAVAGDGTLLRDVASPANLPTVSLTVPPGGPRVSDPQARAEIAVLAAAPARLLTTITQVTMAPTHGLVAQLRNGPSLYFGVANRLQAKWIAAAEVLADAGSQGAGYIDVTDPQRPAAGASSGGGDTNAATGSGGDSTGVAPTSTATTGTG